MAILNNSNAISSAGGYDINNSLRFRSSASAYLSKTYGSNGNTKTWTYSFWAKLGTLSTEMSLLSVYSSVGYQTRCSIGSGNAISVQIYNSGSYNSTWDTAAVYRDPSAWYHIMFVGDTTGTTASNYIKIYVNGVQQTTTYNLNGQGAIPQNTNILVCSTIPHTIGRYQGGANYFDGYFAETYLIDGQALTPSSFGETDAVTGSWVAKKYTGTYGTNGFYLNFNSIALTSGSNTGLGKDNSGNGNYWNTNNISVTAGTTYDAMLDSPTLTSATVANYATWNRALYYNSGYVLSNGNLSTAYSSGTGAGLKTYSSIGITSGKWYWEYKFTASNPNFYVGWRTADDALYFGVGCSSGNLLTETSSGSFSGSTVTVTTNDVLGIAFDYDNGACYFYKNNTLFYTLTGFTTSSSTLFASTGIWSGGGGASSGASTFGQQPFTYTPPTNYIRLNTYNLPDSTIKKGNTVMDATTFTGNGTGQSITNAASFKPDFVWWKNRTDAGIWHMLSDSVRGTGKTLSSNATDAEYSGYTSLTAFNSNGFTLGNDPGTGYFGWNLNGKSYVGWQWQAGQGSTSSNTSGSITSTVSVNTTAGFSIVTYTGTGANATVGHGLGVAPKMVIVKRRDNGIGATNWYVYHIGVSTSAASSSQYYINLNLTSARTGLSAAWNDTPPTSSVFTVGTSTEVNGSGGTFVAYCWAEIAGFSKFGSYTGNGDGNGPFVYTGFRPKYVMIKLSSTSGENWYLLDSARNTYNPEDKWLIANGSDAEGTVTFVDFLSNGFKVRSGGNFVNYPSGTLIYAAFAESPFKSSLAR